MTLQALEVVSFGRFIVSCSVGCHKAFIHGADYFIESPNLIIVGVERGHVSFYTSVDRRAMREWYVSCGLGDLR